MTMIRNVGDVRMDSQLNDEDRRAIRRSKQMTLMAVAAVTVAALLSPTDESTRATSGSISSTAAPALSAASIEPTASISDSYSAQPKALPAAFIELAGDRFETSADYLVIGTAGFAREGGGLPNR